MSSNVIEIAQQIVDFTKAAEQFEERIEHHEAEASKARDNLGEALRHRNEAMALLAQLVQTHVGSPPEEYEPIPNEAGFDFDEEEIDECVRAITTPKPKRRQPNRTHERQRPSRIRDGTVRTREFKYWSGQYVSRARALEVGTIETYYNHKGEYRRAIWLTKPEKNRVMADCLKRYPSHKYNSKKKEKNNE
jgi:hypothetical protein